MRLSQLCDLVEVLASFVLCPFQAFQIDVFSISVTFM